MERGILTELCLYITKTFFLISEIFSSIFLDIFLHPPIGPILVYRTKELRLGCFSSRHEQKIVLFSTPIFGDHLIVTSGDYIGPKKSSKNHPYRPNNWLRKNWFIYVYRINYIIDSLSKYRNWIALNRLIIDLSHPFTDNYPKFYNNRFFIVLNGMADKNIKSKFFLVDLQKKFWNMFVIENKLSLSYRRVKSMHYPESPKVIFL